MCSILACTYMYIHIHIMYMQYIGHGIQVRVQAHIYVCICVYTCTCTCTCTYTCVGHLGCATQGCVSIHLHWVNWCHANCGSLLSNVASRFVPSYKTLPLSRPEISHRVQVCHVMCHVTVTVSCDCHYIRVYHVMCHVTCIVPPLCSWPTS